MRHLSKRHSVSKSSRVLGFSRSLYYRRQNGHRPEVEDQEIQDIFRRIRAKQLAWGFRLCFEYGRKKGWFKVGKTRAYRCWKEAGLQQLRPPKRKQIKRKYQELLPPEKSGVGWAVDFTQDWVTGHKKEPVRLLNLMDEGSRRCLWAAAYRNIPAKKLVEVLDQALKIYGKPKYLRCDNGPELIAQELRAWADQHAIEVKYIQAGKPTQNGLIERLNGTLKRECLHLNWWYSIEELQEALDQWQYSYNHERPHSSIDYQTPIEFELNQKNLYFRMAS